MEKSDKIVILKLKKITVVSLIFMTVELCGGYFAHSIAIMADAFHLLSDVFAYVISLYAVLLSYKKAPKYLAFGYEKAQPLGALINVAIIWIVTIELFFQATHRIIAQQVVQQPLYMLLTSIFGLCCNLYIMKVLHSDQTVPCSHSHGHGHHGHRHNGKHEHHGHHSHHGHQHQHDHTHVHGESCKSSSSKNRTTLNSSHSSEEEVHSHHDHHDHSQHKHQRQTHKHVQKKQNNKCCDHQHAHEHTCLKNNQYQKSPQEIFSMGVEFPIKKNYQLSDEIQICNKPLIQEQHKEKKSYKSNINIQAAYIHIISDIILSIGVIVSASIIYFIAGESPQWTPWQLADPFCTYLFSIVALYSTLPIVKQSAIILMDGSQNPELITEVEEYLSNLSKSCEHIQFTEVRVWSSNRGKHYCAMTMKVNHNFIPQSLTQEGQKLVLQKKDSHQTYEQVQAYFRSKQITSFINFSSV